MAMLSPDQFEVNEAWILFKLNTIPLSTSLEGDFNVFGLMDAASCFLLGTAFVHIDAFELSTLESKRLLKDGYAHKKQYPRKVMIPTNQPADTFTKEAKRHRMTVTLIPETQLRVFTNEAQQGFHEHLGSGRIQ
ncbi:MAG: hypothetical protein GKR96_07170 [Gammaproteobacteria bacterium]|nr:hypothetical protein [Gammaproteobacteria bacterium]